MKELKQKIRCFFLGHDWLHTTNWTENGQPVKGLSCNCGLGAFGYREQYELPLKERSEYHMRKPDQRYRPKDLTPPPIGG